MHNLSGTPPGFIIHKLNRNVCGSEVFTFYVHVHVHAYNVHVHVHKLYKGRRKWWIEKARE